MHIVYTYRGQETADASHEAYVTATGHIDGLGRDWERCQIEMLKTTKLSSLNLDLFMSQQEGLEIVCQSISKRYTIREKKTCSFSGTLVISS